MRLVFASSVVCSLLVACGGRYKTELVGTGHGQVALRGSAAVTSDAVAAPGAGGIQISRGTYDIAMWFHVPRAQVVEWKLVCPGVERDGAVGQTFEEYREQRLAQLRAQAEADRQRAATAANVIVGAVAPRVQASGRASMPGGTAEVHAEAHVPAEVAAQAAADAVPTVMELPPGDVGQGTIAATARVVTALDGVCVVRAFADDEAVRATFRVTRIRDLRQEERERQIAANAMAIEARGQVTARLVALGADPELRRRRLAAEAEARARAAAEAEERRRARLAIEAEARAKRDAEADARRRARLAIEMREREARLAIEAEARAKREAEADARRQARIRAEAEANAKLEARLRVEAELRERHEMIAFEARESILVWLSGTCGAERGRVARREEQRRREHEARLAIELREREARLAIELRLRQEREAREALERQRRQARLDAERREREARLEAERREREARLAIEMQERHARLEAERREREARLAAEALRAQHRYMLSLQARDALRGYLVAMGARSRPPRPAPLHEDPGAPPFAGAEWHAGKWTWSGAQWVWSAGGWVDSHVFGETGGEVVVGADVGGDVGGTVDTATFGGATIGDVIDAGITIGGAVNGGSTTDVRVRDHRTPTPRVRDHRDGSGPRVRDHRDDTGPRVRDHRNTDSRSTPTVRDHRDERSNDDNKPRRVRDHR